MCSGWCWAVCCEVLTRVRCCCCFWVAVLGGVCEGTGGGRGVRQVKLGLGGGGLLPRDTCHPHHHQLPPAVLPGPYRSFPRPATAEIPLPWSMPRALSSSPSRAPNRKTRSGAGLSLMPPKNKSVPDSGTSGPQQRTGGPVTALLPHHQRSPVGLSPVFSSRSRDRR